MINSGLIHVCSSTDVVIVALEVLVPMLFSVVIFFKQNFKTAESFESCFNQNINLHRVASSEFKVTTFYKMSVRSAAGGNAEVPLSKVLSFDTSRRLDGSAASVLHECVETKNFVRFK